METTKKSVKLGVLIDPSFQMAWNALTTATLPVKVSFHFAKVGDELMRLQKQFEAQRVKLVEKYAEKDENGKPVVTDNQYKIADVAGFNTEFADLIAIEEEMASLDHAVLGDDIKLTPQQLRILLQAVLH